MPKKIVYHTEGIVAAGLHYVGCAAQVAAAKGNAGVAEVVLEVIFNPYYASESLMLGFLYIAFKFIIRLDEKPKR